MENRNVEPLPSSDSTQILPPCRSMMRLQIASPIPVPGSSRPCRRLKIPKIRSWYRGSMPIPLSRTLITHSSSELLRTDVDFRSVFAPVFDSVPDQVLENLAQLDVIACCSRQRTVSHFRSALLDRQLQIHQGRSEHRLQFRKIERFSVGLVHPGIREHIVEQNVHPVDSAHHVADELVRVAVDMPLVFFCE